MIMNGLFGWMLPNFSLMGKPKDNTRWLNDMQCFDVFNRVTNIALSRFKWEGLPKTCKPEILEETLYFYGKAVFFHDPDIGFVHTPVDLPGPYNIYYESVVREAYSFNDFHRTLKADDSVLIKANMTMTPDYVTTWNYTPKIADGIRAIDVHMQTLKRPFFVTCQEKEKNSVSRILNDIADNQIAVVGKKLMDNSIQVNPTCSDSHLADMWGTVKNYYNQLYSSLGIKNSFVSKKERVITSEAEGEEISIRHVLESELYCRQEAAAKISEMTGSEVKVTANQLEVFTDEIMQMYSAKIAGNLTENDSAEGSGNNVSALGTA